MADFLMPETIVIIITVISYYFDCPLFLLYKVSCRTFSFRNTARIAIRVSACL